MSVPADGGFGHPDELVRSVFKPDSAAIRHLLDPQRFLDEAPPEARAVAAKVSLRWLPEWLLGALIWALEVTATAAMRASPLANLLFEREPWVLPVAGGVITPALGYRFGIAVAVIFVISVLLFSVGCFVWFLFGVAVVKELHRRHAPVACYIESAARTTRDWEARYRKLRVIVASIFEQRRQPDRSAKQRAMVESTWLRLRFPMLRAAAEIDEHCAIAGSSGFEAATGPIVMSLAGLAEAMRARVKAGDENDDGLLASALDDDELFHMERRLLHIVDIAMRQAA